MHLREVTAWNTMTSQLSKDGAVPKWLRERSAKPRFIGSSPIGASKLSSSSCRDKNSLHCIKKVLCSCISVVWYKDAVMKKRADLLLVERGYAETRQKAQALLLAGQVLVGEQKITKAGYRVDAGADIRILGQLPFASRAGAKIQSAIEHFQIPVADRVCADLGASTGGFTDCLLQNGARRVYAFDVGKGQLAWKLQSDPRVVIRDAFNVRNIVAEDLPESVSLVVADLSFISLKKILGPLKEALVKRVSGRDDREFIDIIVLVKPQFEVGREDVGKGGIVRDEEKRTKALESVADYAREYGYGIEGSLESPVPGAGGNREFLLYLKLPMGVLSSS
jgi:23S rRNA (cytidine1920-2'-O)/16S rRNA (cytidine1409-2'-O)-methyltransferase